MYSTFVTHMKPILFITLLPLFLIFSAEQPKAQSESDGTEFWSTGYLASWQHDAGTPYSNWGELEPEDIDWSALTHVIYFALPVNRDGTPRGSMDPSDRNNWNTDRLESIVPAAHRNDTKILFSVGGSGSYEGFSSAIRAENRNRFIGTLVSMIERFGFDGVDLNMEPIYRDDHDNFIAFVEALHQRLQKMETRNGETPMITLAALKGTTVSELYAEIQHYLDQINIMTYDMAQPWEAWQAWHNSALFSEGVTFDATGEEFSSIKQKVDLALDAGIERRKLGIGIDFYGYIWHGVNYLGKWDGWPDEDLSIIERSGGVPYYELWERFNLGKATWDESAETSYLDIEHPRTFVSFDNERSVQRKVRYAIEENLGGVMIWELGGGYVRDKTSGPKDPLLQAVKKELRTHEITIR